MRICLRTSVKKKRSGLFRVVAGQTRPVKKISELPILASQASAVERRKKTGLKKRTGLRDEARDDDVLNRGLCRL